MSELSIHPLTRVPMSSPSAGDVSRGFTKGSIRVPEGAFCVKLWRSVPLVSITYGLVLPFHGGNTGSNPVGDANKIKHLQKWRLPRYVWRYVETGFAAALRVLFAFPEPLPRRTRSSFLGDAQRNSPCTTLGSLSFWRNSVV